MSETFQERLKASMPALTACLYKLYGRRWDFYDILGRLAGILREADAARPSSLPSREDGWYLDEKQAGYVLYVDLFAHDFSGLVQKIPYLKGLGITYVHL